MIVVAVLAVGLSALSFALLSITNAAKNANDSVLDESAAQLAAESLAMEAWTVLRELGSDELAKLSSLTKIGSSDAQFEFVNGIDDPDIADDLVLLRVTAIAGEGSFVIESLTRPGASAPASGTPLMFGRNFVTLLSNAVIDSYDSNAGTYASQIAGSHSGTSYAGGNLTIGSNGSFSLDSNSVIAGNAQPGPSGGVSLGSNSTVFGTTTSAADPLSYPGVDPPSLGAGSDQTVDGGTAGFGPGNLSFKRFEAKGDATVTFYGPATVLIEDAFIDSANIFIDASGGPVEFYVTQTFTVLNNTDIRPTAGGTEDAAFYVDDNVNVLFDSNSEFTGTLYGPDADFLFKSNVQIYGYVVGRSLELDGNVGVHLDEALLGGSSSSSTGGTSGFLGWTRGYEDTETIDALRAYRRSGVTGYGEGNDD